MSEQSQWKERPDKFQHIFITFIHCHPECTESLKGPQGNNLAIKFSHIVMK